MKRVIAALVVLAALYIGYKQVDGRLRTWYSDNFIVRTTATPATSTPDQICLTWSGDPQTTQAIQWRTATTVSDGWVEYRVESNDETQPTQVEAASIAIADPMLESDPVVHRFTAVLTGLEPATTYTYRAGSKETNTWSEWSSFTTAPAETRPFTFMYLGDPQVGLDSWGTLLHAAHSRHPETAFYVVAGDLVNSGSYRNEWDEFFAAATGVFDRRPIVPVLGNHDYDKKTAPRMYLDLFALPEQGPNGIPPECAYSFHYSNAFFVVLDSNLDPADQTAWLEQQLAASTATWKFALFHHPAYPSAPHRENEDVKELWGALFDKYDVDMALQGHDHAYLRTYPMRGGVRQTAAADGTYYAVSVSGTKYYEQENHDYAEVAFPNVSTYQVIAIQTDPDRLHYRAYDLAGAVKDEVIIEK